MIVSDSANLSLINTVTIELEIKSENFVIETIKLMSALNPKMFLHQPIITVPWNLLGDEFQFVNTNTIEILFSLSNEYFYEKFINIIQEQKVQEYTLKRINTYFSSDKYIKIYNHIDNIEKMGEELVNVILEKKINVAESLNMYFSEIEENIYVTWLLQYKEEKE